MNLSGRGLYGKAGVLPDVFLIASNLLILIFSNGDGRIFILSITAGIFMRYILLAFFVWKDHRDPRFKEKKWVLKMIMNPDEKGAYKGGGADTPIFGHIIFVLFFIVMPVTGIFKAFEVIPFAENEWFVLTATIAFLMRDIIAGRVIYFRFGAGQCLNAGWNFLQVLALAVTFILMWAAGFSGLFLLGAVDMVSGIGAFELIQKPRVMLWFVSIWVLGIFHWLLYQSMKIPQDTLKPVSEEKRGIKIEDL